MKLNMTDYNIYKLRLKNLKNYSLNLRNRYIKKSFKEPKNQNAGKKKAFFGRDDVRECRGDLPAFCLF